MIDLRATNLHWVKGSADDPADLCAHSGVALTVNGIALIEPNEGDWTVSAAALYLLRTLSQPHDRNERVDEHLFPCCGFMMLDIEGEKDVVICECPNGLDFDVVAVGTRVVLTGANGQHFELAAEEWRQSVCGFCDTVQAFYAKSSPKIFADETAAKGFKKFWAEWTRRRSESCSGSAVRQ